MVSPLQAYRSFCAAQSRPGLDLDRAITIFEAHPDDAGFRPPWLQTSVTRKHTCRARRTQAGGATPRKTATAKPTSFRIWCSMKDWPTTTMRTHVCPCRRAAHALAQAAFTRRLHG